MNFGARAPFSREILYGYASAVEKHGTALEALFNKDKDPTKTFEIDEIFACYQFEFTPEHQVALWHFSNTQVLTKNENNSKKRPKERSDDFFQHIKNVNNWYADNEEHAFKVVASNIVALDKVTDVLNHHIPESNNRTAWIGWYN